MQKTDKILTHDIRNRREIYKHDRGFLLFFFFNEKKKKPPTANIMKG